MALIRLMIFGFLAMTIIYVAISVYSRSVRREKLENRWAEKHPDLDDEDARDTYINEGMERYNNGIRPKLILSVYVIPTILVVLVLVFTNWN